MNKPNLTILDELKHIVAGPDSNTFIASDRYGKIKTFDFKTKQMVHRFENPEGG